LLVENTNKGSIKLPLLPFAPLPLLVFFYLPLLVFFTNSLPHHHVSCLAIIC
jgi:hypothetical protein